MFLFYYRKSHLTCNLYREYANEYLVSLSMLIYFVIYTHIRYYYSGRGISGQHKHLSIIISLLAEHQSSVEADSILFSLWISRSVELLRKQRVCDLAENQRIKSLYYYIPCQQNGGSEICTGCPHWYNISCSVTVNSSQCYASVCSMTMMASLGCHVIPALLALTYACDGQISSRHHLLAKNLFSTYCSR